ncbi:uncharacterized protein LOC127139008 [Lates calcarifer]|uniref:Uncharacterized protein LOC127139008 n=1 Tax=Lates calcarifer TaxID=8187 RepID=A0AAJ8BE38_LATCA|nr:uncharacterized protein LOC127139008 [Lates calcarifer]
MDSEEDEVSGSLSGVVTTGDSTEAPTPSTDSVQPSRGRKGRKRRVKTAVTSPDPDDSRSNTGGSVRVLRARGAIVGTATGSKNATCKKKPASLLRERGKAAGSRSKHSPVMQTAIKKTRTKKVSKHPLGPKLSRSRRGKGRPPAQASHTTQATAFKSEAGMEASSCGEETGDLKGSSDNFAEPDAALSEDPPFRDDPDDLIYKP